MKKTILLLLIVVQTFVFSTLSADWEVADSHSDPESKWTTEANSYDNSNSTYASDTSNRMGYGAFLHLVYNTPINSDKLRINADFGFGIVDKVNVWIKRNGVWIDVHDGVVANNSDTEITFTEGPVSEVKYRFNYIATGYYFWIYELQVYEKAIVITDPSASIQVATSIESHQGMLHADLTSDGGSPVKARFEYGATASLGSQTDWIEGLYTGAKINHLLLNLALGQKIYYRLEFQNSNENVIRTNILDFTPAVV
ncbi:MAG: hypothetical protein COA79_21945, partial [Planctomycetota bacterium]